MSPVCGGQGWGDVGYGSGISQVRVEFFCNEKGHLLCPRPRSVQRILVHLAILEGLHMPH